MEPHDSKTERNTKNKENMKKTRTVEPEQKRVENRNRSKLIMSIKRASKNVEERKEHNSKI